MEISDSVMEFLMEVPKWKGLVGEIIGKPYKTRYDNLADKVNDFPQGFKAERIDKDYLTVTVYIDGEKVVYKTSEFSPNELHHRVFPDHLRDNLYEYLIGSENLDAFVEKVQKAKSLLELTVDDNVDYLTRLFNDNIIFMVEPKVRSYRYDFFNEVLLIEMNLKGNVEYNHRHHFINIPLLAGVREDAVSIEKVYDIAYNILLYNFGQMQEIIRNTITVEGDYTEIFHGINAAILKCNLMSLEDYRNAIEGISNF